MTAGCVGYLRLVAAVGFGGVTVPERRCTGAEWLALINECGSARLSCGEPGHP